MLRAMLVSTISGAIVGSTASLIMKAKPSLLACIICGVFGSAIGGFVGSLLGMSLTLFRIDLMGIILAVASACLMVYIVEKLRREA